MYLIKCKCGCIFTRKELVKSVQSPGIIVCPDCENSVSLNCFKPYMNDAKGAGFSVQSIPDNAQIKVSFNLDFNEDQ